MNAKYIRKTKDCFYIQQYYEFGWETVCNCKDREEARANLIDYKQNTNYPTRIKRARERIEC